MECGLAAAHTEKVKWILSFGSLSEDCIMYKPLSTHLFCTHTCTSDFVKIFPVLEYTSETTGIENYICMELNLAKLNLHSFNFKLD